MEEKIGTVQLSSRPACTALKNETDAGPNGGISICVVLLSETSLRWAMISVIAVTYVL